MFVTNGAGHCSKPSGQTSFRALHSEREGGLTTVFDVNSGTLSWKLEESLGTAVLRALQCVEVMLVANTAKRHVPAAGMGNPGRTEYRVAGRRRDHGTGLAACKQGSSGAIWFLREGDNRFQPFADPVVSTIGAGDSFASGFVYADAHGKNLADYARYANACGACVLHDVECANAISILEVLERQLQ